MKERLIGRRRFAKLTGASVTGLGLLTSTVAGATGWSTAETPVASTLYDVEYTTNNAYAVGG